MLHPCISSCDLLSLHEQRQHLPLCRTAARLVLDWMLSSVFCSIISTLGELPEGLQSPGIPQSAPHRHARLGHGLLI